MYTLVLSSSQIALLMQCFRIQASSTPQILHLEDTLKDKKSYDKVRYAAADIDTMRMDRKSNTRNMHYI